MTIQNHISMLNTLKEKLPVNSKYRFQIFCQYTLYEMYIRYWLYKIAFEVGNIEITSDLELKYIGTL